MTKSQKIQKAADIARACAEADDEVAKIRAEIASLPPEMKQMMGAIREIRRDARRAREALSRE